MMTQANNLRDVAQKNYDAALKQIEAEKQQAIFSIVGGCLSFIGPSAAFGVDPRPARRAAASARSWKGPATSTQSSSSWTVPC
ncbi:hypothetical protein [Verrucomicrobium spinosum]|uniref:hypothetical protein n=1 Tax=Verrucomicrobium spinosum TaxID=2736 RepID=UPI0009464DCF|nr:hypothetical protein [Verrucomicrobium spinosum]